MQMIDGDGHVMEDLPAIASRLPAEWRSNTTTRTQGPFPQLDHMRNHLTINPPGAFQDPGPDGWQRFLDVLGRYHPDRQTAKDARRAARAAAKNRAAAARNVRVPARTAGR